MKESEVKSALDEMIWYWREHDAHYAEYYVDALQSARKNLVGETLSEEEP